MNDETQFDCGCIIGTDGEMFVIIPCSLDCEVLRFCIEESKKKDNPIHLVQTTKEEIECLDMP